MMRNKMMNQNEEKHRIKMKKTSKNMYSRMDGNPLNQVDVEFSLLDN